MEKKQFLKAIRAIEKQVRHDRQFARKFANLFTDCYLASYNNDAIINSYIDLLSELTGDTCGWINYWMWEIDFGKENDKYKVYCKEGNEIPLSTAEDLYNLIANK